MKESTAKKDAQSKELPRSQERAIIALLAHPSIAEAAKAAGVSESSIWRWLQDSAFQKRYREAQDKVFDGALGSLQGSITKAVDALVRNLTCGHAAVEVSAAKAILDHTMKARELLDLSVRVRELERLVSEG